MRVHIDLEFATEDVPGAAYNRFLVQALRHLLEEAAAGRVLAEPAGAARSRPRGGGIKPQIHAKSAKSVHRFLLAVAELSRRGSAPTLGEVGKHASLSGPPLAKIVNPATSPGAYAAPLIKVRREGHAKRITLTPRGRRVAAQVAAGELLS